MSDPSPVCPTIDPHAPDPTVIRHAVERLGDGALVAYPTDTLYALGADPRQPAAVVRLFRAKRRAPSSGIPLIAADEAQVEACVGELSPLGRRLAADFWPGPLTLVVTAHPALDRRLLGGRDSVAVRVPDLPVARALAAGLGHPITSTSANVSGARSARTAKDVLTALGPELSMVLDGGESLGSAASTIVDVRDPTPRLIRDGVVPWERVLQSIS